LTGGAGEAVRAPLWDMSASLTGQPFYARYAFNGNSGNFDWCTCSVAGNTPTL